MIHCAWQNFFLYKTKNKNKSLKTYQTYNSLSFFSLSDHNRNSVYYIVFPVKVLNRKLVEKFTTKVIIHVSNNTSKLFKLKKKRHRVSYESVICERFTQAFTLGRISNLKMNCNI